MRDLSVLLPISAAMLHGTGFILYNIQTRLGESKPNPVSWFLWAFLATLNAMSFSEMNNPLAALQFATGSIGCIMTFLYVLTIGKFVRPTKDELMMLGVGMFGIWVWKSSGLNTAYPILAAVIVWSFIPTVWSVWKNPMKEKPMAWWFWAVAFALTSIYTFFWKGGWSISTVVPVVGTIVHGIVPLISTERRKDAWIGNRYHEVAKIQKRITEIEKGIVEISASIRWMEETATDHGSDAWFARRAKRQAEVSSDRRLLNNLQDREEQLMQELKTA